MRLLPFVAAAAMLSASLAHAATLSTIDFNGLPGPDNSAFTSFVEHGFTVTDTSNTFNVATGNGNNFGNPEPDVYTDTTGTLTVTDGGSLFSFNSVDLGFFVSGTLGYTFTGLSGTSTVFTQTSTASDANDESFLTIASGNTSAQLTSLQIAITSDNLGGANIDNIVLSTATTPEPSSIALLGTGMLGVAGVMRKRFA